MLRDFTNRCTSHIVNNPKTTFWTVATAFALGYVSYKVYKKKKECDTQANLLKTLLNGEIEIRKKYVDTECDVLATAARTACKMMEQATDKNQIKSEIRAVLSEELAKNCMPAFEKGTNSSTLNIKGHSAADLFDSANMHNPNWIVDGFMKPGLVNMIVAGAGVGKSILITQIALAVDKGIRPEFLPSESCASLELDVVYYRLEDFANELKGKYGNGEVLKNSNITWYIPRDLPATTMPGFIDHLKMLAANLTKDTLICIDPATKLDGYKHAEFIKGVEEAMEIARPKATVTIVASIHADEIDSWKHFSLSNIKGGDQALQKAGSVMLLRKERSGKDFRFLQCLKEPKGHTIPFDGKVLVIKIVVETKGESKNIYYQFDSLKSEGLALPEKPNGQSETAENINNPATDPKKAPNQKVTPQQEVTMMDMLGKGISHNEIARKFDISTKTVSRHKAKLNEQRS